MCTVFIGLPATALVYSLVSSLATALVMYFTMRRRRKSTATSYETDNRATETVYDTPQLTTVLDGQKLTITDNAAYGYGK